MSTKVNQKSILWLLTVVTAISLGACSSGNQEVSEEEKKEVMELEASADAIDHAVEELDSAVKELESIDELLK